MKDLFKIRIIDHLSNVYKLDYRSSDSRYTYFYESPRTRSSDSILLLIRHFKVNTHQYYYTLEYINSFEQIILHESDNIESKIKEYFKSLNIFIDIRRNNTIDELLK